VLFRHLVFSRLKQKMAQMIMMMLIVSSHVTYTKKWRVFSNQYLAEHTELWTLVDLKTAPNFSTRSTAGQKCKLAGVCVWFFEWRCNFLRQAALLSKDEATSRLTANKWYRAHSSHVRHVLIFSRPLTVERTNWKTRWSLGIWWEIWLSLLGILSSISQEFVS